MRSKFTILFSLFLFISSVLIYTFTDFYSNIVMLLLCVLCTLLNLLARKFVLSDALKNANNKIQLDAMLKLKEHLTTQFITGEVSEEKYEIQMGYLKDGNLDEFRQNM